MLDMWKQWKLSYSDELMMGYTSVQSVMALTSHCLLDLCSYMPLIIHFVQSLSGNKMLTCFGLDLKSSSILTMEKTSMT